MINQFQILNFSELTMANTGVTSTTITVTAMICFYQNMFGMKMEITEGGHIKHVRLHQLTQISAEEFQDHRFLSRREINNYLRNVLLLYVNS